MYLLDTNVVSELRRSRPHGAVLNWIQSVPEEQLYVSAVTMQAFPCPKRFFGRCAVGGWDGRVPLAFHFLPLLDKIPNEEEHIREFCKAVVGMVR